MKPLRMIAQTLRVLLVWLFIILFGSLAVIVSINGKKFRFWQITMAILILIKTISWVVEYINIK